MDKKLFDDLLDSVREAGRIKRGETKLSGKAEITPVDVKAIRPVRVFRKRSSPG